MKINSHPGVRTDLFHRPLHQTLVTDFFGGVAQAEVLPPLSHPGNSTSVPDTETEVLLPQHASPSLDVEFLPSSPTHDAELVALMDRSSYQDGGALGKIVGAWASILIVAVLVGWVSMSSHR